jgi:predicted Rossmann fold nucleotide-binding protein DprA/Smf involved in DNA uptake
MLNIKEHIGNIALLELNKTAFLCSRKVPASIVLKCYDWAIQQREEGNCVISGFHSQIEKDVLHYLLKGNQPIIVVLARGLKQQIEPVFLEPIEKGRLLIITPFEEKVKRVTTETAKVRNQMMIELADTITIGFASEEGMLIKTINNSTIKKEINRLNN